MFCRAVRVTKRVAYRPLRCRSQAYSFRSNSTHNASSHRASQKTTATNQHHGANPIRLENRCPSTRTAHIRFWEPVHTIADVWVVRRALEKKYGTILETIFHKDFETPDRYQMIAFIIFRDLESLKRIPEAGEEFTVLAPEVPKKPIHEIGVKDIEGYAGTDEFQVGFQFDKPEGSTTKRVIGGNIRRSPAEYTPNSGYRKVFQRTARKTMEHFLGWGGFYPAKLDTSQRLFESDLFKPGAREDNTRMRAALQLCSRFAPSPIPQGVAPTTDTIAPGQTVPTPGPSLKTARIFAGLYNNMPAPALGKIRKEEVDEEVDYSIEETVASSSSAIPTPPSEDPPPETPELHSSPSSSSESSAPIPSPNPIKRQSMSPEDKQKLESQLSAARLLKKAATPVRRKQLQPAVVEPAKEPDPQPWIPDSNHDFVVEEKREKKGFLAKLASLFGR